MATRSKKRPAKKQAAAKKKTTTKKKAAKRPPAHQLRPGTITHTELASSDPSATVAWAKKALGWKFGKAMPTPTGPYHMWRFENNTGGGVRAANAPETPGAVPYVEVASIKKAWDKALKAGAKPMMPPEEIPGGMGWIAVVQAPGGPAIGLWAQK